MNIERAYSFCDAMERIGQPVYETYSRIYVGSSFCDQYFLHTPSSAWLEALRQARATDVKLTLVIPITAQVLLDPMKARLHQLFRLLGDALDEAVVNDYAMLAWVAENQPKMSLWCGRLLVKDTRDPRYSIDHGDCKILDHLQSGDLFGHPIAGIELDLTASLRADGIPPVTLGFHYPYGYLSTGRLCEIGSIDKDVRHKFRANSVCARQCERVWMTYESHGTELLKHGRAIYYRPDIQSIVDGLPENAHIRIIDDGFAEKIASSCESATGGKGA